MVPILYETTSISKDASQAFRIDYMWNSSNPQQIGSIVNIYNNATNTLVYSFQQNDYYHYFVTIPENTLQNGVLYYVNIQVIYRNGISNRSAGKTFYCYSSPTFQFTNLTEDQQITSANYTLQLLYQQNENEPLQSYQAQLYDASKHVIYASGLQYNTSTMSIPISGLSNKVKYFFRATGITLTGIEVDTGYIPVHVSYLQPTVYALVELTNKDREGYVNIKSNIVTIEGTYKSVSENPKKWYPSYLQKEFIDLTDPDSWVTYDTGFKIDGDFSIICTGYQFALNATILTLSDGIHKMNAIYRMEHFKTTNGQMKAYINLQVPGSIVYNIYSNYIDPPNLKDLLRFCIVRQGNYYMISLNNITQEKG